MDWDVLEMMESVLSRGAAADLRISGPTPPPPPRASCFRLHPQIACCAPVSRVLSKGKFAKGVPPCPRIAIADRPRPSPTCARTACARHLRKDPVRKFQIQRKTRREQAKLRKIKETLRPCMYRPIPESPVRRARRVAIRLGEYVADHGMEGEGDRRAARDLLMTIAPRLRGLTLQREGEPMLTAAVRIALALDHSAFLVQGPTGSREDLHWRSHDLRTRARREADRHYRKQSQSHPQPSRVGLPGLP
jgi:hypothetical protein